MMPPATSEIILEKDGQRIDCATVNQRGHSIFRHDEIKATGRCKLRAEMAYVPYDDGFEIRKVKRARVFLSIE